MNKDTIVKIEECVSKLKIIEAIEILEYEDINYLKYDNERNSIENY